MALFSTGEAFRRSIVPIPIPLAFIYELIPTLVEQIIERVHLAQHRKLTLRFHINIRKQGALAHLTQWTECGLAD